MPAARCLHHHAAHTRRTYHRKRASAPSLTSSVSPTSMQPQLTGSFASLSGSALPKKPTETASRSPLRRRSHTSHGPPHPDPRCNLPAHPLARASTSRPATRTLAPRGSLHITLCQPGSVKFTSSAPLLHPYPQRLSSSPYPHPARPLHLALRICATPKRSCSTSTRVRCAAPPLVRRHHRSDIVATTTLTKVTARGDP